MAFSCGFYNSIDHDRVYDAVQFGEMFDGLITDGIYATIGKCFVVTPGTGLQVLVGTGRAWFNKTWSVNTASLPINLELADLLLPRIDAIILEVDTRVIVRNNAIKRITGTPAINPVKPELTNADGLYQYPLAYVSVPQNSSQIKTSQIENCIGNITPFVTGILKSVSIEELWNQWQGQFTDWFDNLKTQLDGDIAVNLQRQIEALKDEKVNVSAKATTAQAQLGTNDTAWMTPAKVWSEFVAQKATAAEIAAASAVSHFVTPDQLLQKIHSTVLFRKHTIVITEDTTWTIPEEASGKPLDIILIGGGGGGGGAYNIYSADGGDGGNILCIYGYTPELKSYVCKIGAGGAGGNAGLADVMAGGGSPGGDTSFGPFKITGGTGGGAGSKTATYAVDSRANYSDSRVITANAPSDCLALAYLGGLGYKVGYDFNAGGSELILGTNSRISVLFTGGGGAGGYGSGGTASSLRTGGNGKFAGGNGLYGAGGGGGYISAGNSPAYTEYVAGTGGAGGGGGGAGGGGWIASHEGGKGGDGCIVISWLE